MGSWDIKCDWISDQFSWALYTMTDSFESAEDFIMANIEGLS